MGMCGAGRIGKTRGRGLIEHGTSRPGNAAALFFVFDVQAIGWAAMASFLLAVGRQSAELLFGGPPLGSHGGGMSARSGGSWSTGGEGKLGPTTDPLGHNS